jgi:hypothetical protein
MVLELLPVLVLPILLVLAGWGLARRRKPRTGAPFIDVPDAPPSAEPDDAPGVAGPYSSLDPWAPPKEPVDWSRTDRPPD